jgi:hypothetical protein
MKLRANQCKSCPFKQENQKFLSAQSWNGIYEYLLDGVQHICHSTKSEHICRGARDWQLKIWESTGLIAEATDQALFEAMRQNGIKPEVTETDLI